jgi:hypothetical protein
MGEVTSEQDIPRLAADAVEDPFGRVLWLKIA